MKTRIKHHQFPGDLPKRTKIEMRENPDQKDNNWKKTTFLTRERAILKERTEQEIEGQLDSELNIE